MEPKTGLFGIVSIQSVGQLNAEMYFSFDANLFLRLRKYGRIEAINSYLAAYRSHKKSKTTTNQRIMRAENRMIQKRYSNVNDITVILSHVAKRVRPVRRIINKFFCIKIRLLCQSCAQLQTHGDTTIRSL